jgi:phage regulator Rha-like protein
MDKLVTLKDKVPMTDSKLLAKAFGQAHRFTYELAMNHRKQLERFGVLRFETVKPKTGRPMNIIVFTEEQALMLLTYTRSREKTDDLRHKLIKEFTLMKNYIQKQETIRLAGIEIRKLLTDEVNISGEQERMHGHAYSNYTNMVYYLCGLKSNYKQFKSDQKIVTGYDKLNFRDTLSADDIKRVKSIESMVKAMIELGKGYTEIKEDLKPLFEHKAISG